MPVEHTINFLPFHSGQKNIYRHPSKRKVVRAGRRYGKTTMLEQAASNWGINKMRVGWFAPSYKILLPSFKGIRELLSPVTTSSSKTDAIIELIGGGSVEFWTLDNPDAGRSRKYHKVIIDEGSLVKKGLRDIWEQSIEPTLLDYDGDAIMAGTPKGIDDENFFYVACTEKNLGWEEFHAPTRDNPTIKPLAYERIITGKPPLVVRQEYEAKFVDWSENALLDTQKLLTDGLPVDYPLHCDAVFAVMDTALKGGQEHDGTGVIYFAFEQTYGEPRLTILDWDVFQISATLVEAGMPGIFDRLEHLSRLCGARQGSLGVHIEDAQMGAVLLQKGETAGWPVSAIDSVLTGKGKDERAIMASGHHYLEKCKISRFAYDKVCEFKKRTKNHLITQIAAFHLADKEAHKRADDLLDCYLYGLLLAFGNSGVI